MSSVLWSRLLTTCIALIPVWFVLNMLLPYKPWFGRLKWLVGLDLLLGFALTMLMTWGWVS